MKLERFIDLLERSYSGGVEFYLSPDGCREIATELKSLLSTPDECEKLLKEFTICWQGTSYGSSTVEATSLEEAIHKAETQAWDEIEGSITHNEYPDDWQIDRFATESANYDRKRNK